MPRFTLTGCLLLQAFNDLGVPYAVHELDKMPDGMSVQDVLDNMTGARTVSTTFSTIFTFRSHLYKILACKLKIM